MNSNPRFLYPRAAVFVLLAASWFFSLRFCPDGPFDQRLLRQPGGNLLGPRLPVTLDNDNKKVGFSFAQRETASTSEIWVYGTTLGSCPQYNAYFYTDDGGDLPVTTSSVGAMDGANMQNGWTHIDSLGEHTAHGGSCLRHGHPKHGGLPQEIATYWTPILHRSTIGCPSTSSTMETWTPLTIQELARDSGSLMPSRSSALKTGLRMITGTLMLVSILSRPREAPWLGRSSMGPVLGSAN